MGSQTPSQPQPSDATLPDPGSEISDAAFWRPVQRWGSVAVVILFSGVLLRNWHAMTTPAPLIAQSPSSPTMDRSQPNSGQLPLRSSASATVLPPSQAPAAAPASRLADRTSAAIASNRLSLSPVASPAASPAGSSPGEAALLSPLQAARAKTWAAPNQAYPYHAAIQAASKIQPGQPHYQAAQQEIAGWSRTILSIARQHAQRQDLVSAVRAAAWVPANQPAYGEAQRSIGQWCPAVRKVVATSIEPQQAQAICRTLP